MFYYFYQVCVAVFLIQGASIPFLVALSGLAWCGQSRRTGKLRAELGAAKGKDSKARGDVSAGEAARLILESLPKLEPLKCGGCGGNVLLRETGTLCPYCGTRGDAPEDYTAANALRSEVGKLYGSAVRHWRVANVLTFAPARLLFFVMIFAEPFVLFPAVLVGSNLYRDSPADRAFESLGETASFLLMLSAFLGFVVWMVVFIHLAALSGSLRKNLAAVPVPAGAARGAETANCRTCGGALEYDAGDFACVCPYCNVENLRARFVRRERARAEGQRTKTKSALFGASEIIEEFVGTFFFVLLILTCASVLLALFYAIKNLL
jgi:Zn finger protein HypA/HybF involved in hydrogenase expression